MTKSEVFLKPRKFIQNNCPKNINCAISRFSQKPIGVVFPDGEDTNNEKYNFKPTCLVAVL